MVQVHHAAAAHMSSHNAALIPQEMPHQSPPIDVVHAALSEQHDPIDAWQQQPTSTSGITPSLQLQELENHGEQDPSPPPEHTHRPADLYLVTYPTLIEGTR